MVRYEPNTIADRIMGALIAGGAAVRFGSDKALAPWGGQAMIACSANVIAPSCAAMVVVGRQWNGLPMVDDLPFSGLGPLGGIAGALTYAAGHGFDAVLTIGCDMPDVPSELVERLIAAGAPAFCADAPILGLWPAAPDLALGPALIDRLAGALPGAKDGRLSVRRWALDIGATPVAAFAPLANVNTPADLRP